MRRDNVLKFLASDYGDKRQFDQMSMRSLMIETSLSIKKEAKILDLACGDGRLLIPLAKMYPKAYFWAYDVSPEMLDQLKIQLMAQKIKNVTIIEGDFNADNWCDAFGQNLFDVVILFQAIHFVKNVDRFLSELKQLLVQGGKLIIASTSHEQFHHLPYCRLFETVLKRELARTPDKVDLISRLVGMGLKIVNSIDIEIVRSFMDEVDLRKWLSLRPFSVMAYLTKKQMDKGIDNSVDFWKKTKEYVVDEFSVMTFENSAKRL
jgi:ubiquinone/menaquinone biosynthesis C-methylase UbiE